MNCVMDWKREKQIYVFKIRIGMITERGVPDIFCPSALHVVTDGQNQPQDF